MGDARSSALSTLGEFDQARREIRLRREAIGRALDELRPKLREMDEEVRAAEEERQRIFDEALIEAKGAGCTEKLADAKARRAAAEAQKTYDRLQSLKQSAHRAREDKTLELKALTAELGELTSQCYALQAEIKNLGG